MKRIARMMAAFCFWLPAVTGLADTTCEPVAEKYRVIFGNGILVSAENASASMAHLAIELGGSFNGRAIEYDLAYNHTEGPFADLLQAADQHLVQYDHQFMLWMHNLGLVPDWFLALHESLLQAHYQAAAPELEEHVRKYREAILQGQQVLVVAHSQGNFYANQARQMLASGQPAVPMESFGIHGIATPANNVGGAGGPYLTNHRDIILAVPGSLPANWRLGRSGGGNANDVGRVDAHSFDDTYLSLAYDVRPALLTGLRQRLGELQDPPTTAGSGPVTATLTWDLGLADVDLHAFEPDGSHVFYLQPAGHSGVLDMDNTDSFGPEHYYTDCNQLQTGDYHFAVNYYRDRLTYTDVPSSARPVTVTLVLSVPGATRSFSTVLDTHYASLGNDSPTPLGAVRVTRISDPDDPNRDGLLQYEINSS